MLNIALCDDDIGQLKRIATYLSEFLQPNRGRATIFEFSHPDELLKACTKQRFHLYILDIVMPMMTGIDVGKTIRKLDKEAQIVFVTQEPGFALQSFSANPFNYLLKPVEKRQLFETLHTVFTKLEATQKSTLTVNTRQGIHIFRYSEIVFCEYVNHTVSYMLLSKKLLQTRVIKGSFSQHTEGLMHDRRFIKPHISYIANMDHVTVLKKDRFILLDEFSVPIVAKNYNSVRDVYMDYLLTREQNR